MKIFTLVCLKYKDIAKSSASSQNPNSNNGESEKPESEI